MRKFITIGLLFSFLGIASAQTTTSTDSKEPKATFQPSWYIGLYTGYNVFLGEGNNFFKSGNSFSLRNNGSPLSNLAVGYDFTAVIGLRGELGWARLHWNGTSPVTGVNMPYWWSANLTGDLMVNLSNWWAGYNPNRVFDVQAFVGIGGAWRNAGTVDTKKLLSPIVRAGLQGNFHVTKQFDINVELATNAVSDKFNAYDAGLFFDDFTALQIGFTYHFRDIAKAKPAPAPEPVIQIKEVVKHDTVYVKVPVNNGPAAKTVSKEFSKDVFFTISSASLKNFNQESSLNETVAFLKENPSAKLTIDGYADKRTGSAAVNLKLSKKRAQAVAEALKKAGIDGSRLTVAAHGQTIQPFPKNDMNRLVTMKSSYQTVVCQ